MVCDWSTVDSRPMGHTSHTHVVTSKCLQRTCVNNILGPSKTVHDWWNEEFGPVDKINVSRMWIGWILLGPENIGLWLVEHSFSASGENCLHTHARTHVIKQWPAVWTWNFFGPLHDWSTMAFGPLDNPKRMWPLDHWTIGPSMCPVPSPSDSKGHCKLRL